MEIKTVGDAKKFLSMLPAVADINNTKISWAIMRTEKLIKSYIKEHGTVKMTTHKDEEAYQKKRIAMCEQYCKKDKDGNPVYTHDHMGRQSFDIPEESKEEFNQKMEELKDKEFKDLFNFYDDKSKEEQEMNERPYEGEVYKFRLTELPPDLNKHQLDILEPLIAEEQENLQKQESKIVKLKK